MPKIWRGGWGNPKSAGHLLVALLLLDGGVIPSIIRHIGLNTDIIAQAAGGLVDTYSKVSGGNKAALARELQQVLDNSHQEAKKLGDSHISTEVLFLSISRGTSKAGILMKDQGLKP